MSTKISYSIGGFILGVILGGLLGIGELSQTKKSMRAQSFPILLVAGSVIGAGIGLSVGYRHGRSIHIENVTGISNANTKFFKQGRFWIAATIWSDIRDQTSNQLLTGKSTDGIVISQLNERPIIIHEITSGSKVNIEKYHKKALHHVFTIIKEKFKEESPININDYFSEQSRL